MTTLTAAAERLTSSMLDSKRMFKDEDYPRGAAVAQGGGVGVGGVAGVVSLP